jgi:hypothetical protein
MNKNNSTEEFIRAVCGERASSLDTLRCQRAGIRCPLDPSLASVLLRGAEDCVQNDV